MYQRLRVITTLKVPATKKEMALQILEGKETFLQDEN